MDYLRSKRINSILIFSFVYSLTVLIYGTPLNVQFVDVLLACLFLSNFKSFEYRLNKFDYFIILFLFTQFVALWFSIDVRTSIIELIKNTYAAGYYFVISRLVNSQERFDKLTKYWLFSSIVCLILGLIGYILLLSYGIPNPFAYRTYLYVLGETTRLKSTFTTHSYMAIYLALSIPIYFGYLLKTKGKSFFWAVLFLILCANIASLLTAAFCFWAVLAESSILFLVFPYKGRERTIKFFKWPLAAALTICFIVLNLMMHFDVAKLTFHGKTLINKEARYKGQEKLFVDITGKDRENHIKLVRLKYYVTKKVLIDSIRQHPIIGFGQGNYKTKYLQFNKDISTEYFCDEQDPHCTLLDIWSGTGILGVIGFVSLWWYFIRLTLNFLKNKPTYEDHHHFLHFSMVLSIIIVLICSINIDIMNLRVLWVILGLSIASMSIDKQSTPLL